MFHKEYPNARRFELPEVQPLKGRSLEETILSRRSRRNYSKEPITMEELSRILFFSVGITGKIGRYYLRAYPSAGALAPVEVYPLIERATDSDLKGIYHYNSLEHCLEEIKKGSYIDELVEICYHQDFIRNAPICLILTVFEKRTRSKYGRRAKRYVLLDAGHAGENIYLECEFLGLSTCAIGAFDDEALCSLLEIDPEEEYPVLCYPISRRSKY